MDKYKLFIMNENVYDQNCLCYIFFLLFVILRKVG